MANYLQYFPKPFLKDLINNQVFPIVGSGFSCNAEIPVGCNMPLWNDVGKSLSEDIPGYSFSGALDAVSAYEHEFSRVKLIERLRELLFVDKIVPGATHRAFCQLNFEIVCTTNFEFLLEQGYAQVNKSFTPVIEEEQLSVGSPKHSVLLLKLHGDLHHPKRLIANEQQYDTFVSSYPLFSTFLGNLLISKTPLFIGYSLEDPDFRQVWQVIQNRLGALRRNGYSIGVDVQNHEQARFERRGVKVINLPGSKKDYPKILEQAFLELKEYWDNFELQNSIITEESAQAELSLPVDVKSRLCFFAVPFKLLSFYKSKVFPIAIETGLTPVSADEVLTTGENITAKISALVKRAEVILVDASSPYTVMELGIALRYGKSKRVILVRDNAFPTEKSLNVTTFILRPDQPFIDSEDFLHQLEHEFRRISEELFFESDSEPERLLGKREYKAAVVLAFSLLEQELQRQNKGIYPELQKGRPTLVSLFDNVIRHLDTGRDLQAKFKRWREVRNRILHLNASVSGQEAKVIVAEILDFLKYLREGR